MSQNLLEVQDIKKILPIMKKLFSKRKEFVKVVEGVSFTVKKGEMLSVVGECGCGKSTTGKVLMKLLDAMEERVVDESVSAFDVSIQSQIFNFLNDLREQYNLTYVFITHDLSVVERISGRVGVMYLGRLVDRADWDGLFGNQHHSYTKTLLSTVPILRG